MNLASSVLVIDQNGQQGGYSVQTPSGALRVICTDQVGLSRSRNMALEYATARVCAIADDDMRYEDGYADTILSAHAEYPEADVIAFQVERRNTSSPKSFRGRVHRETYLSCMKISSVEITFKRERVRSSGVKFNELMGAGAEFCAGEESIFLYDLLKAGLRILYIPVKIGSVDSSQSSWFTGFDESYFRALGASYYNMTRRLWPILAVQFLLRKRSLYRGHISTLRALGYMVAGAHAYRIAAAGSQLEGVSGGGS